MTDAESTDPYELKSMMSHVSMLRKAHTNMRKMHALPVQPLPDWVGCSPRSSARHDSPERDNLLSLDGLEPASPESTNSRVDDDAGRGHARAAGRGSPARAETGTPRSRTPPARGSDENPVGAPETPRLRTGELEGELTDKSTTGSIHEGEQSSTPAAQQPQHHGTPRSQPTSIRAKLDPIFDQI